MAFTAPLSTELIMTQGHCMEIFYTEFHPDRLRNMERIGRNLFLSRTWNRAVARSISINLAPFRQICIRNPVPSLVSSTRYPTDRDRQRMNMFCTSDIVILLRKECLKAQQLMLNTEIIDVLKYVQNT